jgi:predicted ArsR family transcriptional regulator
MKELAGFFPNAEVIADFRGVHQQQDFQAGREEIIQLLKRRPCSSEDIADGLLMHLNEVLKYIEELMAQGLLEKNMVAGKTHYFLRADQGPDGPGPARD